MACREGINSVIVSIAYFLTKTDGHNSKIDDSLVKKAFHSLKTEESSNRRVSREPAPRKEVLSYLNEQISLVQASTCIPEHRKPILLSKLQAALDSVTSGENAPSKAIVNAWKRLPARVEDMKEAKDGYFSMKSSHRPYLRFTEVQNAILAYEAARELTQELAIEKNPDPKKIVEAREQEVIAKADMHAAIKMYDTTDEGYRALLANDHTLDAFIPLDLEQRISLALSERHVLSNITAETLRKYGNKYRVLMREYLKSTRIGDKAGALRIQPVLDKARSEYTSAIIASPLMRFVLEGESEWETNPVIWSGMKSHPDPSAPTRDEQWMAVEIYARRRDYTLVESKSMTVGEAEYRKKAREACRNTVLRKQAA